MREHLAHQGLVESAARGHYLKALAMVAWFLGSYLAMTFTSSFMALLACSVSAGMALAGLAFNVQHDGGHGAFSGRAALNGSAARVLDLLGMSSYLWRFKHNLLHHQNPNVN
ncbi:MAG: fatty acid desaturase, partial [Deltaproteobacteria bacterium]|nr:fatty acid desaturase [Deltaproteobacteria bacterium]